MMTGNVRKSAAYSPASLKGRVLIVDDDTRIIAILTRMLESELYEVVSTTSGHDVLNLLQDCRPDLVLLDIRMPDIDGFAVCEALKKHEELCGTPVIFISGIDSIDSKVDAFKLGAVDFIPKPFHPKEITARVDTHIRLFRLQRALANHNEELDARVKRQVAEISEAQLATIFALAKLAESRDDDTGAHLERVQHYCKALAVDASGVPGYSEHIGDRYIDNLFNASPLHDIGKVGVPDAILKKPGKLTRDEFEEMKAHTVLGATTLEAVSERYRLNDFIKMGIAIARSHHEKWDGNGYPDGLSGKRIPLSARILAVADVYDALRAKRCYKPALSHEKARDIIINDSGSHFDPTLVQCFKQTEQRFLEISMEFA